MDFENIFGLIIFTLNIFVPIFLFYIQLMSTVIMHLDVKQYQIS